MWDHTTHTEYTTLKSEYSQQTDHEPLLGWSVFFVNLERFSDFRERTKSKQQSFHHRFYYYYFLILEYYPSNFLSQSFAANFTGLSPAQGNFHIAVTRVPALFRACQHKGFLFVNKSLYTFWLWTCALSFPSQKDSPRASLCFQSCSVSPRHQPSCAVLLNYVSGIAKRACLGGDWGQTPQALGQKSPRQCMPVSRGKVLPCADAEGSQSCRVWGADVLLCFCHTVLGLFWWKWEQELAWLLPRNLP